MISSKSVECLNYEPGRSALADGMGIRTSDQAREKQPTRLAKGCRAQFQLQT